MPIGQADDDKGDGGAGGVDEYIMHGRASGGDKGLVVLIGGGV